MYKKILISVISLLLIVGSVFAQTSSNDTKTHGEFSKAYQSSGAIIMKMDPAQFTRPEVSVWAKSELKKLSVIVAKFKDKENADVKKDLQLFAEIEELVLGGSSAAKDADISNYPNYSKDLATLNKMQKYNENKIFSKGNEQKASDLNKTFDADKITFDSLYKKYKNFIAMNNNNNSCCREKAKEMQRAINATGIKDFAMQRKEFFDGVVVKIENSIKEINNMIVEADKKENRYAYDEKNFIKSKFILAKEKLSLYGNIVGEKNSTYQSMIVELDHLQIKINDSEEKLTIKITASTKTPPDLFKGKDREKVLALTVEAFKKVFPKKSILAKGISSKEWKRSTEWRSSGGTKYKVDSSRILVWIITQKSQDIATTHHSSVSKNHMKENQLIVYGFNKDKKGHDMLRKNVKGETK